MINEFQRYILENRGYSEITVKEYGKDLRQFVTWLKSNTEVTRWSEVKKETIETWVATMSENGMKPASIKRRISTLRSFYQWTWQTGLGQNNPAKYVSTPKKAKNIPECASPATITTALHDACTDGKTKLMIAIIAETGVRLSELLALRGSDIDETLKCINIYGKGNKQRTVYYGEETTRLLDNMKPQLNAPLFPSITDREAREMITAAVGKSPHKIRHTFGTMMLNNGASLKFIGRLMGHSSVTTTEIYTQCAGVKTAQQYLQFKPNYSYGRN